jgi:hypothetical protein
MNIFYLSHKPSRCARWHCDKHVVKMILETCQLLYTAHWVLAAAAGGLPDLKGAPPLKGDPSQRGYRSIRNKNHPCAIWTRESREHYFWLCHLGLALCDEFRHRFRKQHSCFQHLLWLTENAPAALKGTGWRPPAQAMPPEYQRQGNSIAAYRAYYTGSKGARGLLVYSKRHRPHWISSHQ